MDILRSSPRLDPSRRESLMTWGEEALPFDSIDYFIKLIKMLKPGPEIREKLELLSKGVCTNLASSRSLKVLFREE